MHFICLVFLLTRQPPRPTRPDTLFLHTTPFRSAVRRARGRFRWTGQCSDGVRDPAGEGVEVARGVLAQRRAVLQPGIAGRGRRTVTELPVHQTVRIAGRGDAGRSEEHTSELQSLMRISYAVFCLKKQTNTSKQ